jgi:DNA-directed RNA polymerase specialized sigma24 family protein
MMDDDDLDALGRVAAAGDRYESGRRAWAKVAEARAHRVREAIAYARDEGYTVQEIADALGWSRPKVYDFMQRQNGKGYSNGKAD